MNITAKELKAMQRRVNLLMTMREALRDDWLKFVEAGQDVMAFHAHNALDNLRTSTDEYSIAVGMLEMDLEGD